jgi:hypothetical protein
MSSGLLNHLKSPSQKVVYKTAQPLLTIKSDRLAVAIAAPGSLYRGSRFDWSSFVTQVVLDASHTFCGTENPSAGKGGMGLCCEFGLGKPIGYNEALPGGQFVKPGVGLLTRPARKSYTFWTDYPVEPFAMLREDTLNAIAFTSEPRPCNGYALRLTRRLAVTQNHLDMHVVLQNTGEKPIATDEYCHNFITIDGHGTGPDLSLVTGFDFAHSEATGLVRTEGNVTRCAGVPATPFYALGSDVRREQGVYWVLKHVPSGVGLAESGSFALDRFAFWGCDHVVSPEAYVAIQLAPGQTQHWQRRFTFFGPDDVAPPVSLEA